MFDGKFAPQGWRCPICGRVYNPSTDMCYYCGNTDTYATSNIEIKFEGLLENSKKEKNNEES